MTGIGVRILQAGDDHLLRNVAPGVFDNPTDPELTREFLEDPRHHIAVALGQGVVVAFASAVHYVHPDKRPQLWINEVAVAPTHQRHGVGKTVSGLICSRPRPSLYGSLGVDEPFEHSGNGSLPVRRRHRRR